LTWGNPAGAQAQKKAALTDGILHPRGGIIALGFILAGVPT